MVGARPSRRAIPSSAAAADLPVRPGSPPGGTPAWGADWKRAVARYYDRSLVLSVHGACQSWRGNYLDLDPTVKDQQFCDVGSQYRTGIFYVDDEQKKLAEASRAALDKSKPFKQAIVTEITPTSEFWRAEEYHQQYLEKRGLASCHI